MNALKTFVEFDAQWAMITGYDYAAGRERRQTMGSTWLSLVGRYTFLGRVALLFTNLPTPIYGGVQPTWVHASINGYF